MLECTDVACFHHSIRLGHETIVPELIAFLLKLLWRVPKSVYVFVVQSSKKSFWKVQDAFENQFVFKVLCCVFHPLYIVDIC